MAEAYWKVGAEEPDVWTPVSLKKGNGKGSVVFGSVGLVCFLVGLVGFFVGFVGLVCWFELLGVGFWAFAGVLLFFGGLVPVVFASVERSCWGS